MFDELLGLAFASPVKVEASYSMLFGAMDAEMKLPLLMQC